MRIHRKVTHPITAFFYSGLFLEIVSQDGLGEVKSSPIHLDTIPYICQQNRWSIRGCPLSLHNRAAARWDRPKEIEVVRYETEGVKEGLDYRDALKKSEKWMTILRQTWYISASDPPAALWFWAHGIVYQALPRLFIGCGRLVRMVPIRPGCLHPVYCYKTSSLSFL